MTSDTSTRRRYLLPLPVTPVSGEVSVGMNIRIREYRYSALCLMDTRRRYSRVSVLVACPASQQGKVSVWVFVIVFRWEMSMKMSEIGMGWDVRGTMAMAMA